MAGNDALKRIVEFGNPRTMKTMHEAGALNIRSPLALARALPWLVGRGPSLGILAQMNGYVLGDKPAIHDRSGTLTFSDLDLRSNQAARAFQRLGLTGGDKLALIARNGREMIETALGAQKSGLIACPLNTWAKEKELKATLGSTDPKVLLYDTAHSEQVESTVPEGTTLLFVGDPTNALPGSLSYEEALDRESSGPIPPFTRNRGSAQVVIHTSGTTGTPKGAARDSSAAGLGALTNLLSVVPYRRDDVVLCPAPLFHSFGLATFTFATALGATLVLPEKFDPEESLALIDRHRATAASFVPVMLRRIARLPNEDKKGYDLSSLRVVLASGSALTTELRRASIELFGPVLYDLYGSTEAGWVAIATPDDIENKPQSVGKPVPGIELKILSPEGEELPPGETGEVFVKSEVLFAGYTAGEEPKTFGSYMSIGDLGRMDEDDYLFIEGRADDMVVVGGENIYPIEVEEVIESVAGVNEVTVLGIDDDEYGKVLVAFFEGSADPSEIESRCKKDLASYKVPRKFIHLDDLPRTSTGKVIKRELVAQLEDSD